VNNDIVLGSFLVLVLDKPGSPYFEMSSVTDYRYGIGCGGSKAIQSVQDIGDCPTNVRVVKISAEIGFETSYEIWKAQLGNVLWRLEFRKYLSWQIIALNGRVNEG
jgi:hypothetical protein